MKISFKDHRGFTLLELLLVIGVIGILSSIVVVAVNPTEQLRKARDTQRTNEVGQIQKALEQYYVKNNSFPATVLPGWGNAYPICQQGQTDDSCINIDSLVPDYISEIPIDPSETGTLHTGYEAYEDSGRPFVLAPNLGETLPTDYIARWRFMETGGTTLIDSSENGNNLTCATTRCPVYGELGYLDGYAAKFESTVVPSTYDYFYSYENIVDGATEATFCSWAQRFDLRQSGSIFRHWATDYRNYYFGYQYNTLVYALTGPGGATYTTPRVSDSIFGFNTWHHICVVFDGETNTSVLHVDETKNEDYQAGFNALGPTGTTTYLGLHWNGLIDDLRIYNRALSAEEIQALRGEGPRE